MKSINKLSKAQKTQLLEAIRRKEIAPSEVTANTYVLEHKDDFWTSLIMAAEYTGHKFIILCPELRSWVKMAENHVFVD